MRTGPVPDRMSYPVAGGCPVRWPMAARPATTPAAEGGALGLRPKGKAGGGKVETRFASTTLAERGKMGKRAEVVFNHGPSVFEYLVSRSKPCGGLRSHGVIPAGSVYRR